MAGEAGEACPACGAGLRRWRLAGASDPHLVGVERFRLARCPSCGTAKTLDRETPLPPAAYESGAYAPARRGADAALAPLRALIERDKLRFMRGLPAQSRVFEVGAGDGSFVARLRAAGLDASGIEPSHRGAEAARERGLPVRQASLEQCGQPAGSLDGAIAWHVLEHLDDPGAALGRLHVWLRAGGRLVVACPNLASVQARIGGDLWFHQDVPRHRVHFTERGLRTLVERRGFAIRRVSHLLLEQNPLGMWQTLLNRLTRERDFAFRVLKRDLHSRPGVRDLAATALAGPLLAPVAVLAELVSGLAGRGGSIVVVATRVPGGSTGS